MSNYINLIGQITERLDVPCGNIRLGIHEALAYLDRYPDQVPGRTITRSEMRERMAESFETQVREIDVEAYTESLGRIVVPDPEPTNAEKLNDLLMEFTHLNAPCGGEVYDHDFGEFLTARGVKAPEADDE